MTRQRIAILACLSKHPGHYSAAEIFELAKKEYPALSRATVYNALPVLVAEGKLRKIAAEGMLTVYDTTLLQHGHVICPVCGAWQDVCLPGVDRAIEEAFGNAAPYTLSIQSLCDSCKKSNK